MESGSVAAVAAAADALVDRLERGVDPHGIRDDLKALRPVIDRLELAFSILADHLNASQQYLEEGYMSPHGWLKYECKMTGHAAASAVCVGDQLSELPASHAAMARGEIGFAHLTYLARTADAINELPGGHFDEAHLLRLARRHPVSRFRTDCMHERHAAHERAYLAEQEKTVEARELRMCTKENGCLEINGFFDPEGGAILRTALEPLARRLGVGDHRLRTKRLADAMVELAEHRLDSGTLPSNGGVRPHLQVTCTLETLQGTKSAPAGELEWGGTVAARTVQRLACDATLIPRGARQRFAGDRRWPRSTSPQRRAAPRNARSRWWLCVAGL